MNTLALPSTIAAEHCSLSPLRAAGKVLIHTESDPSAIGIGPECLEQAPESAIARAAALPLTCTSGEPMRLMAPVTVGEPMSSVSSLIFFSL
ncbi:hypothetical protein APR49_28485 [Variovorax paradoxus]|nr:hypothetical protein APR49_28485 [Variovorax paradoxus]